MEAPSFDKIVEDIKTLYNDISNKEKKDFKGNAYGWELIVNGYLANNSNKRIYTIDQKIAQQLLQAALSIHHIQALVENTE